MCVWASAKSGPIYDVAWSPNSSQFCVVFGFMPAKATVYNLKCDPVFDFGTGPRNAIYYRWGLTWAHRRGPYRSAGPDPRLLLSPQGHILVLAGFGNLQGHMEVWDMKKRQQVCGGSPAAGRVQRCCCRRGVSLCACVRL